MSNNNIIAFEGDRAIFKELLKLNTGVFIFQFTADWCKPCKIISPHIDVAVASLPVNVVYFFRVDVDVNFDLYAYLKQKKMVSGIPTLLAYKKGNVDFASDDSHSGSDINALNEFFSRCIIE